MAFNDMSALKALNFIKHKTHNVCFPFDEQEVEILSIHG